MSSSAVQSGLCVSLVQICILREFHPEIVFGRPAVIAGNDFQHNIWVGREHTLVSEIFIHLLKVVVAFIHRLFHLCRGNDKVREMRVH